jgi:hypothetical protein
MGSIHGLTLLGLAVCLGGSPVAGSATVFEPQHRLKLLTPAGYLPQIPVLVRVEVNDASGRHLRDLWEAEATLGADSPGIALSTNRVRLHHGMGSALVSFSGSGDFRLTATLGSLQATRALEDWSLRPVRTVGGLLPGASSTWSGVILVTNDVTVPLGHTLTIESNTVVLINGVTGGTVANDISVNGAIRSLGTEFHPVTITCAQPELRSRWGQIRHSYAQPSVYRWTSIMRGGRAFGEGHTGTGPVIRPVASRITFESCNLTDHAETSRDAPDFGTPGKVLQASLGSDLTFNDCLMARSRMGPEISETALLLTNSYIVEMYGVNDSDGLLLGRAQPGQAITITGCVLAEGDDDGIDTEGATFTVDDCLIRDWNNDQEDSKGISVGGGEAILRRSLLVDNLVGVSGKGTNGEPLRVRIDHCTILAEVYAVGVTNKTGTTPLVDYRITNSIVWGVVDSVFTQYNPADIHIDYSNLGQTWPGQGNTFADPRFVSTGEHNYRLEPYSPCIDAGDPLAPFDADGSPTDAGCYTFLPPPPILSSPQIGPDRAAQFWLSAYPNRLYVVEQSADLTHWTALTVSPQTNEVVRVTDTRATNSPVRFYRAHLAP